VIGGTPMRAALFLALLVPTHRAVVRVAASQPAESRAADSVRSVPFGVGEKMEYDVVLGGARVGSGQMRIADVVDVRDRPSYHSVFNIEGGLLWYKVNDRVESWFDTTSMSSVRFWQDIHEGKYTAQRKYEIFPESSMFHQEGDQPAPSVPDPLDDGSFLYFIRTIPLEVGKTYEFQRYFRPDRNPVTIKVLRKEKVRVPAGSFDAIVIQPLIKTPGIFSDKGEAQIWLSDDARRVMLQVKSKVKIVGSLDLYLTSYQPPTTQTPNGAH